MYEKKINSLISGLQNGTYRIGVWGTGYIGCSTMAAFARKGIRSIGVDTNVVRVEKINSGKVIARNFEQFLGCKLKPLVAKGMMRATNDWKELLRDDIVVHFIAVPTEKNGLENFDALIDVFRKLTQLRQVKTKMPHLVIIESTLTPNVLRGMLQKHLHKKGFLIGKDILVGAAPRRDWFISPDKSLETLPRVMGGSTAFTTKLMGAVLALVCTHVVEAEDHLHAALVKCVENAFRCVNISLANQLAFAYPHMDIVKVLEMAGTKWNMGTYTPSFGIGGYCIPLAPQYLIHDSHYPDELSICKEALKAVRHHPEKVVEQLVKQKVKRVGILGGCYKRDIPVHVLSPALAIIRELKKRKISVKLCDEYMSHDPHIAQKECGNITFFDFPRGLAEFDALLIVADHEQFRTAKIQTIKRYLTGCKIIYDGTGMWQHVPWKKGLAYHRIGSKDWI